MISHQSVADVVALCHSGEGRRRVPVRRHAARDDQICPIFSCLAALTSHDECLPQERERDKHGLLLLMLSINDRGPHHRRICAQRSAHRRVSTNSCQTLCWIALENSSWGPAYYYLWLLFKLIKPKNTAPHHCWCVKRVSFVHPSILCLNSICDNESRVNHQNRTETTTAT